MYTNGILMAKSATQLRTASNDAQGLIFAALILPLGIAPAPALANGIQMLPPVTQATKTYPDKAHPAPAVPTTCSSGTTGGSPNILTWDGTNPITCATGVTVTGGNVGIGTTAPMSTLQIVNGGTAQLGSDVVLGEDTGRFGTGGLRFRDNVSDSNTTLSLMPNGSGFSDLRVYSTDDPTGTNLGWGEIGFAANRATLTFSTGSSGTGVAPTAFAFTGGDVGIGTTDPKATLDVNGPIKLGNGSGLVATACSTVGAIAYDSTTDSPVYCKAASNTWNQVSGCQWLTAPAGSRPITPVPTGLCRFNDPAFSGSPLVYGTVFSNADNNSEWACFVDWSGTSGILGGSWVGASGTGCLPSSDSNVCDGSHNWGITFQYYACGD